MRAYHMPSDGDRILAGIFVQRLGVNLRYRMRVGRNCYVPLDNGFPLDDEAMELIETFVNGLDIDIMRGGDLVIVKDTRTSESTILQLPQTETKVEVIEGRAKLFVYGDVHQLWGLHHGASLRITLDPVNGERTKRIILTNNHGNISMVHSELRILERESA